jgi:hypothetical protein
MPGSVFSDIDTESYPFRFKATLSLASVVGGVPSDPKVAEGWLRSKLQETDERIQEMVAQVMEERKVTESEAVTIVNNLKNLNGFKRTSGGQLFIEGRQVKAMLKEATSIAVAVNKIQMTGWGATKKWLTKFLPEHVFVVDTTIVLKHLDENDALVAFKEPTGIHQQFVHTFRGSAIQYQEYCDDAVIEFTVISDHNFTTRDWKMIWTTAEKNGLGASRSQGYGTFAVTGWEVLGAASSTALPGAAVPTAIPKRAVKKAVAGKE